MGVNSESNTLVLSTTENGCVYRCRHCRAFYVEFGTVVIKLNVFGLKQLHQVLNGIDDAVQSEDRRLDLSAEQAGSSRLLSEEQRTLSPRQKFLIAFHPAPFKLAVNKVELAELRRLLNNVSLPRDVEELLMMPLPHLN